MLVVMQIGYLKKHQPANQRKQINAIVLSTQPRNYGAKTEHDYREHWGVPSTTILFYKRRAKGL